MVKLEEATGQLLVSILDHQPDLIAINKAFPVPNYPMTLEMHIVMETLKNGPNARMPLLWAAHARKPTDVGSFKSVQSDIKGNRKPSAAHQRRLEMLQNSNSTSTAQPAIAATLGHIIGSQQHEQVRVLAAACCDDRYGYRNFQSEDIDNLK